jgi:hypothetical protein
MRSNQPASRFFLGKAVPERNCPPSLEPAEKGVPFLGKRDGTLPFLISAVAEGSKRVYGKRWSNSRPEASV